MHGGETRGGVKRGGVTRQVREGALEDCSGVEPVRQMVDMYLGRDMAETGKGRAKHALVLIPNLCVFSRAAGQLGQECRAAGAGLSRGREGPTGGRGQA